MPLALIRKLVVTLEQTRREGDRELAAPVRRVVAAAVIANPYAGRWADDLSALIEIGAELGALLAERALEILGAPVENYGKAAIVGEDGELEHAAAILHPKFGAPVRERIGGGLALIPSAKKRAGMGATIDIPLGHKDAAYVRSHFDAIECRIADAPRRDEIMVALALAEAGRPWPRIGGLSKDKIEGKDGLR
jgi:hypothetical protein